MGPLILLLLIIALVSAVWAILAYPFRKAYYDTGLQRGTDAARLLVVMLILLALTAVLTVTFVLSLP